MKVTNRKDQNITQREAAEILTKSRDTTIVEINRDLKLDIQSKMVREFIAEVSRYPRTKDILLIAVGY